MVRNYRFARLALLGALAVGAVSAQAVTFTNIIVASPPMSTGWSSNALGNAISFFTPNAMVGDVTDPVRSGTLNIQFDAYNDVGMTADQLTVNLAAFTSGSGRIDFAETVIELDSGGNELLAIGSATHTFLPGGSTVWDTVINFSHPVFGLRVKKVFVLTAPATDDVDLAAIGIINQAIQVVPEPATMAALGFGAIGLLARKRRK